LSTFCSTENIFSVSYLYYVKTCFKNCIETVLKVHHGAAHLEFQQETEAGGAFEPRSSRPVWATKQDPHLKNKQNCTNISLGPCI
jgi:hypothetical protein